LTQGNPHENSLTAAQQIKMSADWMSHAVFFDE